MQHRIATLLVAAVVATGCKEKSTADLAQDTQKASGDVANEQKDVRKAQDRLEESQKAYRKQTDELEHAQKRAGDARSDLAKRVRQDSAVARTPR